MLLTRMIHIARRMGLKNAYKRMMAIFKNAARQGPLENFHLFVHISTNLFSYLFSSLPKQSKLTPPDYNKIINEFETNNIPVKKFHVNVDDFRKFKQKYQFSSDYIESHKDVFIEKALEHYLSHKFLMTRPGDIFIDVASADSPWADMLTEKEAIKAYSLDLCHEEGINGNKIGANVIDIPLPDNSVSSMALHCSLEVFENNTDIDFFNEANRILKHGGG